MSLNELSIRVTAPELNLEEKGAALTTRGQNALLKSLVRKRAEEAEAWIKAGGPAQRIANETKMLKECQALEFRLLAWKSFQELES